ncbi:hypothetical protein K501DRAFT_265393 [Backusella circina FSU 941]|nr:hypothetical protein K501DRAFT_265393 [Backusella circina FSU 941]
MVSLLLQIFVLTENSSPANNTITISEDQSYFSDVLPKFIPNKKQTIPAETMANSSKIGVVYGPVYINSKIKSCVIVYWFLQSISFVYNFFVEKEEVFVGSKEKYSPIYKFSFNYGGKTMPFEKNVSAWFSDNNILVKDELDKDLKEMLDSMKAKVQ